MLGKVVFAGLCAVSLWAREPEAVAKIDPELSVIKRSDSLPASSFEDATDQYLEGYIQALIDMYYYEFDVIVVVRAHKVTLYNLPKNDLLARSIVTYVQDLPGVESVRVRKNPPKKEANGEAKGEAKEEMAQKIKYTEAPRVSGIWFPQSTVLFLPLVADPREPVYSVNYRFGDKVIGRKTIAVSLGDDFPIFRWYDVFRWHGDLQIGITAGVWAVFNFSDVPHRRDSTCQLINTDYMVGIPLTYAFDKWSFRLRTYHVSGHLGDEALCDRPHWIPKRRNPSFEATDLIGSYQFSSGLRMYGGPGVVWASDKTFRLKPLYVMWGTEIRLFGQKLNYHRLFGTPFFAAHMENWEERDWDIDCTFKLGYEFSKLQGVGRKMRFYIAYHQGFSYEGQFFDKRTQYGELGFSWGF